jgi:hypothetical protein
MADDVLLHSRTIAGFSESDEAQLRRCLEENGVMVKTLGLTLSVFVPGAESNDAASAKALQAVESCASGAGWEVAGFLPFGQISGAG